MEQFALLRQKAKAGEQENADVLASALNPQNPDQSASTVKDRVWDTTANEAERLVNPSHNRTNPGTTDEEKAYFKSIKGNKRGDGALSEHLERKVDKTTKRQRTQDTVGEMEGIPITKQNAKFNEQL